MKIGIAFSTYMTDNIREVRGKIIRECVESLKRSTFDGEVVFVDDASPCTSHHEFIEGDFELIKREVNGGYSKTKNTGIGHLYSKGCDIIFAADDDIVFLDKDWANIYAETIVKSGIPHFSFYSHNCYGYPRQSNPIEVNGVLVNRTSCVQGGFMTFTRELLDAHGYLKIFPAKLGYEHAQYTFKLVHRGVIPGNMDIVDSTNYIDYNKMSEIGSTRPENWGEMVATNFPYLYSDFDKREDCVV